jgi:hypothetical protein
LIADRVIHPQAAAKEAAQLKQIGGQGFGIAEIAVFNPSQARQQLVFNRFIFQFGQPLIESLGALLLVFHP